MSTAGASTTLTVGAGFAADSTGVRVMKLAAAMAKTTAAWVAGTTNGGLDTGAIAASTWYHWFLIYNPTSGVVDVLFSLSATAPTMPSGYTLFRRIGSMKTNGSSQWIKFTQRADEFIWDQAVQLDANTATLTSPGTLFALSVPTGVQVNAVFLVAIVKTATNLIVNVTSPDQADNTTFTLGYGVNTPSAGVIGFGTFSIRTNTSAQIRATSSSSGTTFQVTTAGWIDDRGKLQ
jgi:hypothetical protein